MPDAIFCRYCGQKREAVHHGPPVESMNLFQTVLVFLCSLADPKRTPELWSCFNLRIFRMRCYAATPLFSSECSPPQVETQSVQSINYNSLFSGATGFFGPLPGILGVWPLPGEISWCFLKGTRYQVHLRSFWSFSRPQFLHIHHFQTIFKYNKNTH
jgi:hypothetical protein